MHANDVKRLVLIQKLLHLAILLLLIAEFSYLLSSMFDYIWGIVGAAAVLLLRFGLYKFSKQTGWMHIALMIIPGLMILGPLAFVFIDLFRGTGLLALLDLFLVCAFVLPILIMAYASRSLAQIQQRNAPE